MMYLVGQKPLISSGELVIVRSFTPSRKPPGGPSMIALKSRLSMSLRSILDFRNNNAAAARAQVLLTSRPVLSEYGGSFSFVSRNLFRVGQNSVTGLTQVNTSRCSSTGKLLKLVLMVSIVMVMILSLQRVKCRCESCNIGKHYSFTSFGMTYCQAVYEP